MSTNFLGDIEKTSEWALMVKGEMYNGMHPDLVEARRLSRCIQHDLNTTHPNNEEDIKAASRALLPRAHPSLVITPPFFCDYGLNITIDENFYANFDCVILDVAPVTIGKNVLFGPKVQVYTPLHPLDPTERAAGPENAKPITIGDNVWVAGGAVICPGVTIGDGVTIGAGSVVTRDIPAYTFAAGNPARVIRHLNRPPTEYPSPANSQILPPKEE